MAKIIPVTILPKDADLYSILYQLCEDTSPDDVEFILALVLKENFDEPKGEGDRDSLQGIVPSN